MAAFDDLSNPFGPSIPKAESENPYDRVDPFAVLRVVSQAPVRQSPAKQMADAATGKNKDNLPSNPDLPADSQDKAKFQKGPLKGMDKVVFFAMLSDTLSRIGGRETNLTRDALEVRQRQAELAQRQDEVRREREFRENQARLDREARASEVGAAKSDKQLDRENALDVARMRIDSDKAELLKRQEIETEALGLQAKHGVRSQAVREVFDGVSSLEGLRLPPGITPEAAFEDPVILEEARRLIAPFKERQIFKRIEAERGNKEATRNQEVAAALNQASRAWTQGVRMVNEEEQKASGDFRPFQPLTRNDGSPRGTLDEMTATQIAALGPAVIRDPAAFAQARESFIREAWGDFLLRSGVAWYHLDGELQRQYEDTFKGMLGLKFDDQAQALDEESREKGQAVTDFYEQLNRSRSKPRPPARPKFGR